MASQLIFKPGTPRHICLVLGRVLDMEIKDRSFGHPAGSVSDVSDDDTEAEGSEEFEHDDDVNGGLGEARGGHSPFTPDPARNEPRPGPIPDSPSKSPRRPTARRSPSAGEDSAGDRQRSPREEKQKADLKDNQYAYHCQMCLCESSPRDLAPAGSYIEAGEVRRRIMEAHHVDPVSAGVARHVGNVILLCKKCHDNYGARLNRSAVTAALRDDPKERSIDFGEGAFIKGRQIEIGISSTGEPIQLFFTDYHADYWLKQAPDRSGAA